MGRTSPFAAKIRINCSLNRLRAEAQVLGMISNDTEVETVKQSLYPTVLISAQKAVRACYFH